jgi:hypothetical protein
MTISPDSNKRNGSKGAGALEFPWMVPLPARTTRILPRHGVLSPVLRQPKNTKPPYVAGMALDTQGSPILYFFLSKASSYQFSSISWNINELSDQLAAGEIKLIEVTPEESPAAKTRLNEARKKRRERHTKKKQ